MTAAHPSKRRMHIGRSNGLILRVVDDHGFLLDARQRRIHHLNPTALAVWRLMQDPQTIRGIGRVLKLAFPEVSERDIKRDTRLLVKELLKEGLAERVEC
jgi:Coenzyme PQQ synthesis protein D (PqqD)